MRPCSFFFNDTATTEIYTLALHDALPIARSAIRSSLSSRPTEMRTTSGPAPACVRCSSVSWRWAVEAGGGREGTPSDFFSPHLFYFALCFHQITYIRDLTLPRIPLLTDPL